MREIKFRVFDGEEMLSLSEALHTERIGVQHNRSDSFELEEFYKSVKLMQYTGLKDKNGVEIYEGDKLSGHAHKTFIVKITSYGVLGDSTDNTYGNWNITSWVDEMEVIGNIYENKELL